MQGKSHTVFFPLVLQMSNKTTMDFIATSRKSAVNLQALAPLTRLATYGIDVSSIFLTGRHSSQLSPKMASSPLRPLWGGGE